MLFENIVDISYERLTLLLQYLNLTLCLEVVFINMQVFCKQSSLLFMPFLWFGGWAYNQFPF